LYPLKSGLHLGVQSGHVFLCGCGAEAVVNHLGKLVNGGSGTGEAPLTRRDNRYNSLSGRGGELIETWS
jgi:hypothetical protein